MANCRFIIQYSGWNTFTIGLIHNYYDKQIINITKLYHHFFSKLGLFRSELPINGTGDGRSKASHGFLQCVGSAEDPSGEVSFLGTTINTINQLMNYQFEWSNCSCKGPGHFPMKHFLACKNWASQVCPIVCFVCFDFVARCWKILLLLTMVLTMIIAHYELWTNHFNQPMLSHH